MWGPSPGPQTLFFQEKKLVTFLVITVRVTAVSSHEKLVTFFWSSLSLSFILLVHSGVAAHYFRHAKKLLLLLWGAFFGDPFGQTC